MSPRTNASPGDPFRIVQWTTGNVGRRSVVAAVANPDLELVGGYAWGADKVGRDVGELCGIEPLGILATDDVDALLALEPDCVVYNPKWPDVDEMVRILEAGVNIVSTAAFITGAALGDGRQRIEDACARGGSSVFGSGINPGFIDALAIFTAGICDRVDSISVLESADSTGYDSPETELPVGFARPIDDPALQDDGTTTGPRCSAKWWRSSPTRSGSSSTTCGARPSSRRPPKTSISDRGPFPRDASPASTRGWQGWVADRKVVELAVRWRKGNTLEPDWQLDSGYLVEVQGQPCVRTKMEVYPPPDFEAKIVQRLHGARDDHDRAARDQRHPRRLRRRARHRHLPGSPARDPAGVRAAGVTLRRAEPRGADR